jgi:hypothetical protein
VRQIRSQTLKELKIKFNDNRKPFLIEGMIGKEIRMEDEKEIYKILGLKEYQSVKLTTNNNTTIYFEKTFKKKI